MSSKALDDYGGAPVRCSVNKPLVKLESLEIFPNRPSRYIISHHRDRECVPSQEGQCCEYIATSTTHPNSRRIAWPVCDKHIHGDKASANCDTALAAIEGCVWVDRSSWLCHVSDFL